MYTTLKIYTGAVHFPPVPLFRCDDRTCSGAALCFVSASKREYHAGLHIFEVAAILDICSLTTPTSNGTKRSHSHERKADISLSPVHNGIHSMSKDYTFSSAALISLRRSNCTSCLLGGSLASDARTRLQREPCGLHIFEISAAVLDLCRLAALTSNGTKGEHTWVQHERRADISLRCEV